MNNKFRIIITFVIVVLIGFVTTIMFTQKDYSLEITDENYKNSPLHVSSETDDFVTYFSHEWKEDNNKIYLNVVYDFKVIKNNSASTVLGIIFNEGKNYDIIFSVEHQNKRQVPIFSGNVIINNHLVTEIDNQNEEDYSFSTNQLLYMYKHNKKNIFFNNETLKEEKIKSIRVELDYIFSPTYSDVQTVSFRGLAVNQTKGKLTDVNDLGYIKKDNKVIKDRNRSIFNRVKFSSLGNISYIIEK